jgi:hypothetical protein
MVNISRDYKGKSGIYCILNIQSNKKYIGSSTNLWQRLQKHFSLLRHNKHENVILQNSFNKHGEKFFMCFCLEFVEKENLLEREQYYINTFNCSFNITKNVIRNTLSKSSRLKISETLKKGYQTGVIKSQSEKEIYVYTSKGVFIETFKSLRDCSKKMNIHCSSIIRVCKNIHKQCKGFVFYYEKPLNPYIEDTEKLKVEKYSKVSKNNKRKYSCVDTQTNEKLVFNSSSELAEYFQVTFACLTQYIRINKIYKKRYELKKLAPLKSI